MRQPEWRGRSDALGDDADRRGAAATSLPAVDVDEQVSQRAVMAGVPARSTTSSTA